MVSACAAAAGTISAAEVMARIECLGGWRAMTASFS
jgi:hypothetical protein